LPETWDRILSTSVDAEWTWKTFDDLEAVKRELGTFDQAFQDAKRITCERFALENSPSVQNAMYLMAGEILQAAPKVESVNYALPNKHYFEIGKPCYVPECRCASADFASRSELV
jgi:urate oxidase